MKGDGVEEGGVKEEGVGRGRGGGVRCASRAPPFPALSLPSSQLPPSRLAK